MKSLRGFTLIELMITLAVAAILLTVAVPNFRELIERNRVSSHTNLMVGALQLARSEAIKRGSNLVILCKSSDGSSCSSSANWKDGWLLFADKNSDKVYSAGTDDLIRRYDAMPKLSVTTGNSFQCWIGFGVSGYPEGGGTTCSGGLVGNGTFSICAASTTATQRGRSIIINKIGRIRTEDKTCT
jgi:type IV fimbrial biogenesis protein FimT